jgi:phosphoglycolate phosphatase-like HAD superfamily hydrolase
VQSNSSSKQQPVLGRAAVLQELKQRGYMTLPVFEVQRETLLAAQADIQAWMEALMSGGEEPGEPDPDDALAAAEAAEAEEAEGAEGADSSSSSSKQERKPPVSPLLKAWSAARYDTAAAAEGVEEDADAAAAAVAQPPLAEAFAAWCESAGLDPNGQLLSVCDAAGGELLAAVRGGVRLLQDLVYRAEQGE